MSGNAGRMPPWLRPILQQTHCPCIPLLAANQRQPARTLMPLNLFDRLFRRRRPIEPLSQVQREILLAEVPFYGALAQETRARLDERIPVFLAATRFEGCNGLELTEAMRLLIAAEACRLRLGHDEPGYPDLRGVLLYPDDFLVPMGEPDESGVVTEGVEWRSGESWQTGSVVLSWREIRYDVADARARRRGQNRPGLFPARNLVLHEFAHQLDFSYGLSTGIDPDTGEAHSRTPWTLALSEAYTSLWKGPVSRRRPALDDYGAESPAELFAVAVESFFETPDELRRQYPALHEQLEALLGGEGARGV